MLHPEDVLIKTLSSGNDITIQVIDNENDLGRVIGEGEEWHQQLERLLMQALLKKSTLELILIHLIIKHFKRLFLRRKFKMRCLMV